VTFVSKQDIVKSLYEFENVRILMHCGARGHLISLAFYFSDFSLASSSGPCSSIYYLGHCKNSMTN